MKFDVGTLLVSREKYPSVAIITESKPSKYSTPVLELESDLVIEFESDGSIHDYWTRTNIEEMFYEFSYGMIVYCWTGKSSFCIDRKPGFYKTPEFNPLESVEWPTKTEWLGKHLPGSTQEEFQRAYKLKAFW